jgi:hypothetical protein
MIVRCLSFHASYRCANTGVCCSSGWPIGVEPDRSALIAEAHATAILATNKGLAPFVVDRDAPPELGTSLNHDHGLCVFRDRDARECRVHSVFGHGALPLACRQFPRVSLIDPRGVSVTLSHYCPTAESLLNRDAPVSIRADSMAFPADGEYVGLDARTEWPPLLRPGLLMDWEAVSLWEEHAVTLLTDDQFPLALRLSCLAGAVDAVSDWTPSDGPLGRRIDAAFLRPPLAGGFDPEDHAARVGEVRGTVPADRWPSPPPIGPPSDNVLGRFLAAHAFGNWTMHLGNGLRSWQRSLEAAHALAVSGLGIGPTDLILRHLADPVELAEVWKSVG